MTFTIHSIAALLLIAIGLHALLVRRHLIRQILALNVVSGGIFLLLIASSRSEVGGPVDPVPQALVLTGIIVTVSVTGLAIAISRRIHSLSRRTSLRERDLE